MSRFGRSGPPPIRDTYSLLVLNITFREFPASVDPFPSPGILRALNWCLICIWVPRRHDC
uniref:Arginine/serine-rich splicing factor SC30 transcript III n=1 Tax=Sorghum bicolor TaxID=4558 RepID=M1HAH1_SORBI|nr:arginine/serine-rich splicing factor SC30 transcript III [Sorghum bicolor]